MITKLEELSMNAFPALSTVMLNNWVLRFSKGYSKRANSVNPLTPCSDDETVTIDACELIYNKQGLPTVFKLTESEYGMKLDNYLASRGYTSEARTNVLLKRLDAPAETNSASEVHIEKDLTTKWFNAFTHMNKISEKNKETLWQMFQITIPNTYFASLHENDEIVAVGLGVAQGEYIGMFDIYVKESSRRKGYAEQIMNGLMQSAQADGVLYTYLQVVDANEPAKALYKKLGYEKQYSYWYRVKG